VAASEEHTVRHTFPRASGEARGARGTRVDLCCHAQRRHDGECLRSLLSPPIALESSDLVLYSTETSTDDMFPGPFPMAV